MGKQKHTSPHTSSSRSSATPFPRLNAFFTTMFLWLEYVFVPWVYFSREMSVMNGRLGQLDAALIETKAQVTSLKATTKSLMARKIPKEKSGKSIVSSSTSTKRPKQQQQQQQQHQPSVSPPPAPIFAAAPPPPPPPPPPPMMLPPTYPVSFKKTTLNNQLDGEKKKAPGFNPREILAIKLRKTSSLPGLASASSSSSSPTSLDELQPLERVASMVSLETLKAIKLKKVGVVDKENLVPEEGKKEDPLPFLMKLRKSGADRSPGGTPFRQSPLESGSDGLTPMLSNALKKKFKQANGPLSPKRVSPQKKTAPNSPLSVLTSPLRSH